MPEDLPSIADELTSSKSRSRAENGRIPPVPSRPSAEPRAYESLNDNDPEHVAGNEGDGTQAS